MPDRVSVRLLALDTALEACTVGLVADGRLLAGQSEARARGHAERLVPMVAEVLRDGGGAPPDAVVVTRGPGSFTGQRVALAAARAFGLAWGVPVVGLTTLEAVAAQACAQADGSVRVVLAVGRGGLAVQDFGADATPESPAWLAQMADLAPTARLLAGSAAAEVAACHGGDVLPAVRFPDPCAMAALALSRGLQPSQPLAPIYLSAA
jgi:tRNA threonylcarbamoyl adenosine modification protein YeaZ